MKFTRRKLFKLASGALLIKIKGPKWKSRAIPIDEPRGFDSGAPFHTWLMKNRNDGGQVVYIAAPDLIADEKTGLAIRPGETLTLQMKNPPTWPSMSPGQLNCLNLSTGEHWILFSI
jgi:hypothetical protein